MGEVDKGAYHPETRHRTFADLCDHYLANTVFSRTSTEREYRASIECYLRPYFAARPLQSLKVDEVVAFRKALTVGYPPPIAEAIGARRRRGDKLAKARHSDTSAPIERLDQQAPATPPHAPRIRT